jgi:ectoine hydroxylase-related dioxygenase (phytanoyl-CoA dioxygenase family)
MESNLFKFQKNGYCIFESIPTLALLELKKNLYSLIQNSFSKNIAELDKPISHDHEFNKMFIELEKKDHAYITKIFDAIRLTPSFLNVVISPKHLIYCKKLLGADENVELFMNSMSVRMDPPGSKAFSYGWHTDGDINIERSQFVQAWIPLVDIDEKLGGLEIIENSHINEIKSEHTDEIRKAVKDGDKDNNPLAYRTPANTKIISPNTSEKCLTANFGQTVFFSNQLMHRSGLNLTEDKVRIAVTCFYHRSDLIKSGWY